jgi:hypothetical protein
VTHDPDLHGPPEHDHDDDDEAERISMAIGFDLADDDELWADAAREQAEWEASDD